MIPAACRRRPAALWALRTQAQSAAQWAAGFRRPYVCKNLSESMVVFLPGARKPFPFGASGSTKSSRIRRPGTSSPIEKPRRPSIREANLEAPALRNGLVFDEPDVHPINDPKDRSGREAARAYEPGS